MPFHRGITRGRWPTSITTLTWPGVCLGVILGVLAPWLTVMAADEEGFVVPPDGAMRAAGPVGRERDIAESLATRERTKGAFGIFRIEIAPKSGPPTHIHRGEDEFFYVLKGTCRLVRLPAARSHPHVSEHWHGAWPPADRRDPRRAGEVLRGTAGGERRDGACADEEIRR
jgi:hypothetical protein